MTTGGTYSDHWRYILCDNGAFTDMLRRRLHARQSWKDPPHSSPPPKAAASSVSPLTGDEGYHKVMYLSCAYLSVRPAVCVFQSPVRIPVSPRHVLKHCIEVFYHNRRIYKQQGTTVAVKLLRLFCMHTAATNNSPHSAIAPLPKPLFL